MHCTYSADKCDKEQGALRASASPESGMALSSALTSSERGKTAYVGAVGGGREGVEGVDDYEVVLGVFDREGDAESLDPHRVRQHVEPRLRPPDPVRYPPYK